MFDFQSEALQRIGTSAPELSAYVLRFQDLSDELPEGTNYSVGVLILGAPSGLFYIPAIAYGMVVQPFDSIIEAETGKFMPFSNVFIQKVLTPTINDYGKAGKIPKYVSTNPSIYNLVVPPRTGKVSYASHSVELLAALPRPVRLAILGKIKSSPEVANAFGNVFELADVLSALNREVHEPTLQVSAPEVEIVTPVNAKHHVLTNAQVQDVLNVGYTVVGDNITPRMAIPKDYAVDALSTLSACREGTATFVVRKDGTKVLAMIPKQARKIGDVKVTYLPRVGVEVANHENTPDGLYLAILSDGSFTTEGNTVVAGPELEMSEAVKELYANGRIVSTSQINTGETFVLVSDKGTIGPLVANRVSKVGHETQIDCMVEYSSRGCSSRLTVISSPAFKGTLFNDGTNVFVNSESSSIILSCNAYGQVENRVSAAYNRQQLHAVGLLESSLKVQSHRGGLFSVNGVTAESEADAAKILIIDMGLGKQAALKALEVAKEKGVSEYHLSKKMDSDIEKAAFSMSDNLDDFPSYGNPALEQPPLIDSNPMVEASETGDPEVMSSVIVTQFMNNPDVFELISAYIPQLDDSVDKLGRTILLLRLNTDADKAASIMNVLSATRNTFKLLGESVEKLKRISNGYATAN